MLKSNFLGVFPSKRALEKVNDVPVGTIAFIKESHNYAILSPETNVWTYCSKENAKIGLGIEVLPQESQLENPRFTVYDINKAIVAQLPEFTEEDREKLMNILSSFYTKVNAGYFMLLSKEASYYTVFTKDPAISSSLSDSSRFAGTVLEVVESFGTIKDASDEGNHIDIWIAWDENQLECFHLFAYDLGIVKF